MGVVWKHPLGVTCLLKNKGALPLWREGRGPWAPSPQGRQGPTHPRHLPTASLVSWLR